MAKFIPDCSCGVQVEEIMISLKISKQKVNLNIKSTPESNVFQAVVKVHDSFVDDCWFTITY